jgi:predicted ArsR family transcriptional regulator
MKQTVYLGDFRDAFRNMDRGEQFSYEGLGMIYDWFEQMEDDMGTEIELDVIAICCDFSEEDWSDIAENYEIELDADDSDEENMNRVVEHLEQNTSVVGVLDNGSIIYQNY